MNKPTLVLGWIAALCLLSPAFAQAQDACEESVTAKLRVDTGNPWRPPFGLERVGAPPVVHVELEAAQPLQREYLVVAYRNGREVGRRLADLAHNPTGGVWGKPTDSSSTLYSHIELDEIPDEVVLIARCESDGRVDEVARQAVEWPAVEADATARAQNPINPVDLGAVLVPQDRLLLAGGQRVQIEFAAISRTGSFPDALLSVWFDDGTPVQTSVTLAQDQRVEKRIEIPSEAATDGGVLQLALTHDGRELWRKDIHTMIVANPPQVPRFGAVETKLRYDAPVVRGDKLVDYGTAWDPKLNDVVVFLPNGSRFVFWRWFFYAPFWAGTGNTALNYEWAENLTHPFEAPGWGTLFPEPLFDQELRYGRVRIVESTPSRVHVRWTYEGTDPQYRRWGEQVAEDFYFYPDGFGTRVMTLASAPNADYEVSEFIVLTPQGAYPLEILPERVIEILYLDGEKRDIDFPVLEKDWRRYGNTHLVIPGLRNVPALYRIFQEKEDPAAAIFFSPRHIPKTAYVYQHSYKEGEVATPALGDRGVNGPGFNCFWTAIKDLPEPVSASTFPMLDALGQSREMMIRRWAWLIAKTDAPDAELLEWAQSYSAPPALEVTGAHIDFPSYVPERRAMRLVADSASIEIKVKPATHCVNPVFELSGAPTTLVGLALNGEPVASDDFAWDGSTLWVKARIDSSGATIGLQFR